MIKLADLEKDVIDALEQKIDADPDFNVPVVNPPSVDPETYILNHAEGELLVFTGGLKFKTEKDGETILVQYQDNLIEVWPVIRKSQKNNPADYIDFVIKALRGGKTETNNPKSKIYPLEAEFVYEKNSVWFYRIAYMAPNTNRTAF